MPAADPPPPPPTGDGFIAYLLGLPRELRPAALAQLGPLERESFDRDWASWAHNGQAPPEDGDWSTWVLMAGRGFGKTLAGSNWITALIAATSSPSSMAEGAGGAPLSIALVGATLDEARRVMVEGRSGLLEVADAWVKDWCPSLLRLTFTTGAQATLFSGASPEQLRGPEHHFAWCDELAKWEKPGATWDMLQLGLRLGMRPRVLVTTTPRPGPDLRRIMASARSSPAAPPTPTRICPTLTSKPSPASTPAPAWAARSSTASSSPTRRARCGARSS